MMPVTGKGLNSAIQAGLWLLILQLGLMSSSSTAEPQLSPQCSAMLKVSESAIKVLADNLTTLYRKSFGLEHYCYYAPPCDEVDCIVAHYLLRLRFSLLKCDTPPAIRLVTEDRHNSVVNDYTLSKSQRIDLLLESSIRLILNVTLNQYEGAIGLSMVVSQSLTYEYSTLEDTISGFIPYTRIPINTTDCSKTQASQTPPGQINGGSTQSLTVAITVAVVALLVLIVTVIVLLILMVMLGVRRRRRAGHREEPLQHLTFSGADEESDDN